MTRLEQLLFHSPRRRLTDAIAGLCSQSEQIRVFFEETDSSSSSMTAMSHDT